MIEFSLYKASHQITPDRIKSSYTSPEVIQEILNWLHPYNTDYVFNPQTKETIVIDLDEPDYLFELYLDAETKQIGIIAGDIPTTRAIIDLNEGTFTEQVSMPFDEGSGPVSELNPMILDYLRILCEDLSKHEPNS